MDQITFNKENSDLIKAVENSFGPSGRPLSKPGRVLMGQGRLMKVGRQGKLQPKDFFLFNDVLVYGGIIMNGHWRKNQKVIPLEGIQQEDIEDSDNETRWLILTPSKSFFVSAPSLEEKRAWIEHIKECQSNLLQADSRQRGSTFAVTWIPDHAAFKCMRCLCKFTKTKRRHHCRKCGFLVCNSCSKQRAVIDHIHPTKKLRVCRLCHTRSEEDESSRQRGDSTGINCEEEQEMAACSDEAGGEEAAQSFDQSSWPQSIWPETGHYDYPKPMHLRP